MSQNAWMRKEGVQVLQACGFRPGGCYLDFGCGFGDYSIPMAIAAGPMGKVMALDVSRERIRKVQSLAGKYGLHNLEAICSKKGLALFADHSLDGIAVYDLIHALSNREDFLKQAARVLKPRGLLSILPFHMSPSSIHVLEEQLHAAGFVLEQKVENGGMHFESQRWSGMSFTLAQCERGTIYNWRKRSF